MPGRPSVFLSWAGLSLRGPFCSTDALSGSNDSCQVDICRRGTRASLPLLRCCTYAAAFRSWDVVSCTFNPHCLPCVHKLPCRSRCWAVSWCNMWSRRPARHLQGNSQCSRLPSGIGPAHETKLQIRSMHCHRRCCWYQCSVFDSLPIMSLRLHAGWTEKLHLLFRHRRCKQSALATCQGLNCLQKRCILTVELPLRSCCWQHLYTSRCSFEIHV